MSRSFRSVSKLAIPELVPGSYIKTCMYIANYWAEINKLGRSETSTDPAKQENNLTDRSCTAKNK